MVRLILTKAPDIPKENQTTKDRVIATTGLIKKSALFLNAGTKSSLENSLIASLNGWGTPPQPTLLGPFRNCEYPKIFRSIKVIKATFTRTGIKRSTSDKNFKISLST
jgi:hypothetical protein